MRLQNDRPSILRNYSPANGEADRARGATQQEAYKFSTFGMAVHGLKNPASGIATAAEYLIEDRSADFTEKQLLLLRGILNSASSMLRLIDELKEVS